MRDAAPTIADGGAMSAAPDADVAWATGARAALARTDAALAVAFDRGDDVDRLVAMRAGAVDDLIRQAWTRCVPAWTGASLHAVGGYGRGELFPQSDIDLLVLADDTAQQRHGDALSRFLALLWDAGLQASQAVRSVEQCIEAADDQTVLTALMESRALVADTGATDALRAAISPERIWSARDYFQAKREEQVRRHARYGDTSDNLEPNLKDGPGGLRDIQTLRWMAQRMLGSGNLESMLAFGQIGAVEFDTLERERKALSRLRFGLHLVAGRREERLRFDYQKLLAARLGHTDDADNLAVEQMMQGFYRSAGRVLRINDRLLQRFEEQLEGEGATEVLDDHFELRRGYLAARDRTRLLHGTAQVFELFAAWAAHRQSRGLHSMTAWTLAEALPSIPAYTDATPELREQFLQLLRGPQPVKTLERMARLGVLGRWIPAFAQVSGRMQFDLFHVYTVDQHTLAVLRNLALFASGVADERFSIAHTIWPSLRKPELMLLAGLFHDIGKGRGGDHSELGAVDAREFCVAHGVSEADTALIEWLVRKHLLMSVTAQKQDITDPDVIHRFATEVADRERLDHLYLLTCADIAGTSPKLWNAWKDRLLADLHTATRFALRRGLENPVAADERIVENRSVAHGLMFAEGLDSATVDALFARMPRENFLRSRPDQIAWQALALRDAGDAATVVSARLLSRHGGGCEVLVCTPDRDGLFAAIVITLDRLGLAIQQARALDGPALDGHGSTIFDTFHVLPVDADNPPSTAQIEAALRHALTGDLDRLLPSRRTQPRHLKHFRISPRIGLETTADGRHTQLSLICTDRPGLLADVSHVLRRQRVRVQDARIATFGERAEDLFLIASADDAALDDAQCATLRDALREALDGPPKG
jgi:[protein-PII] uridylyltransferase